MVVFGQIIRKRFDRIEAYVFHHERSGAADHRRRARSPRSFVREKEEQKRFEGMNKAYVRSNCILGIYSSTF